jgi:hypothetical protein
MEKFEKTEKFTIFTSEFLLERGYCCGNGCRHCPYDYKNVPEPRKSKLLEKRNENEKREVRI